MTKPAKMACSALLCWLVLIPARAAEPNPAVLRLQVALDAGVIRVSDLWANAGPKADTVIGPAPPPGRSIAIEAGQLAYIARLYDVEWRPTSGVERTAVERAGRPLSRDEVSEPIRRSLVEAGAAPDQANMRAEQVWQWIYHRGARDFAAMSNVAKDLRAGMAARFTLARPEVAARQISADGTRKYLLRVAGGLAAFSGFYFAIAIFTDSTYRAEFLDEMTNEMRDTFRARAEYCHLRGVC